MAGTITHEWNGTTLIITSDSGTSSCDLKGEKGDMGVRGAQGIQGDVQKGEKGDKGDTGATGEKGDSVFIKYSPYADGSFMESEWHEGLNYMGVAIAQSAPINSEAYQWHRIGEGLSATEAEELITREIDKFRGESYCWEGFNDLEEIDGMGNGNYTSATFNGGGSFMARFAGNPISDVSMDFAIRDASGNDVFYFSDSIPEENMASGENYYTDWVEFELVAGNYTIWEYNAEPTLKTYVLKPTNVVDEMGDSRYAVMSQKAVTESVSNNFANALKGSASGEIVAITDNAPITYKPECKVTSSTIENLSTVKIKKYGKNLCELGTRNVSPTSYINLQYPIKGGYRYQVSALIESTDTDGETCNMGFFHPDNTMTAIQLLRATNYDGKRGTAGIFIPKDVVRIYLYAGMSHSSSQGDTATFKDIQIERTDKSATEYEPFIEPIEYRVLNSGEIEGGMVFDNPNITLVADTVGAQINCTYNRDINKAFAELQAALATATMATAGGEE